MVTIDDIGDDNIAYAGDDQQAVADILFKTDYDPISKTYHVRLIGGERKVKHGFKTEAEAMEWIPQFIKFNSKEV